MLLSGLYVTVVGCLQEQSGPAAAALRLKMHSTADEIPRQLQCGGQGKTGFSLQSFDVCSQCWWVHSSRCAWKH
jgi:hypothetical protein